MSSAIEVLKKYSTSCSVCKYNGGDQCKASEGELGECEPAEELNKAINEALLALEQKEKRERLENDALCSITNEDTDILNLKKELENRGKTL